jgi:tetratricopeptide (TPR) repeat protein
MASPQFADNPHYREYERLLIELHRLMAAGESDTDAADVLRDQMDDAWFKLSEPEQQRLRGLSGDLYFLQGREVVERLTDDNAVIDAAHAIQDAAARRDWEQILELLRRRPANASLPGIIALRALAYAELGHRTAALEFLQFGIAVEPDEPHLRYHLLSTLEDVGEGLLGLQIGLAFEGHSREDLYWLVQYVASLTRAEARSGHGLERRFYQHAADQLSSLVSGKTEVDEDTRLTAWSYLALGLCYERLGDTTRAEQAFARAKAAHPDEVELEQALDAIRAEDRAPNERGRRRDLSPAIRGYIDRAGENWMAGSTMKTAA